MPQKSILQPKNDLAVNVEARGYRETVTLWPKLWKKWAPSVTLQWTGRPFSAASRRHIPTTPGVYAFVVQPGIPPGVPHAVLMYVGMSDRPLRQRFGEYLREMTDAKGRAAITTMLQMYEGFLYFYYASISEPGKPQELEAHLLETLLPPINKQYPASVRRITGAF